LAAAAKKYRVTLNTLFQAMWGLLLQRYNNTDDVLFGAVVSGRPAGIEGIESMVGLFINTVPVRVRTDNEKNFPGLVRTLHQESLLSRAYEYQPLAEIQANSSLKDRLIDHVMVFENYPVQEEIKHTGTGRSLGFFIEGIDSYEQTNYDFDLTVVPGKNIRVIFTFNSNAYATDFIKNTASHFKNIVQQVVENPQLDVKELEILSPEERQQLLYDFNDTESSYPGNKTLHELFEKQVQKTPDNVALVPQHITYRELNAKSDQLAGLLLEKGVQPETIVGLMVERSVEMIIGIFGILKAGGAYLPIDPDSPAERIDYMMADSGAGVLVSKVSKVSKGIELILIDQVMKELTVPPTHLTHLTHPTHLSYIIYTSGSTGQPKGVMVEHRNLLAYIHAFNRECEITSNDTVLQQASFTFDTFVEEVYSTLLKGGKVAIASKEEILDVDLLVEFITRNRVTVIDCSPLLLNELNNSSRLAELNTVHTYISGGDELKKEYIGNLLKYGKVLNGYGPTETTVCVTLYHCSGDEKRNIPIGKPLANYKVYILDRNDNLLPVGVPGELCAAGAGVTRGYLNNPESTIEKFPPAGDPLSPAGGPTHPTHPLTHSPLYRTGDLARWLPNGPLAGGTYSIEFLGRIDHQVKIRGFRIELGEIENQLKKHEEVEGAVAVVKEDEGGDKYLCAYIVPRQGTRFELDVQELKKFLARHLPQYMIPLYFIPMETLPLTPGGKVDRNALPEPERSGIKETHTAPVDEVEEKLVELWADLLKLDKETISTNDDFFLLGGHSLRATMLVSRIRKVFNIEFKLAEVFETPTVKGIADYVRAGEISAFEGITPVEKREYYPQSSAQKRLFFLDRFEDVGTSYNMPLVLEVAGEIDKDRVKHAFRVLIRRHETLRTSFHMIDNEPVQKIHPDVVFEIERLDIEHFIRPFDLSRPPLLRVGLVEIARQKYLFLFDMHHIISDGTSTEVLQDEFLQVYAGEALPQLKIQYRDFSSWQNNLFKTGEIKEQEDYWRQLYSDSSELPVLNLPTDYPRPAVFDFKGDHYHFSLGMEESRGLKAFSGRNGVTVFMSLLTAFNVLLHKYTDQSDIIVGCGIAGRRHADLQQVIGLFVNMLALRNAPFADKTYLEFLGEVKNTSIKAFENQDLQFEELVDKLELPRDASRNPLFDVAIVNQNFEQAQQEIKGLTVSPYERSGSQTAKFDLILFAQETEDNVHFNLEYYTSIFNRETIRRMTIHFINIIRQVNRDPAVRLSEIDMVTDDEKQALLYDFNQRDVHRPLEGYPNNRMIHELFENQVERTPGNTAVFFGEESLTYRELEEKANRVGQYLFLEKNMGPGHLVGILLERSIDMIAAILGVLKSGSAYVPIDPSAPEDRIKTTLDDAGIGVVISSKRHIRLLNRLQWECPAFHTFLCLDSLDVYSEEEKEKSQLMDEKLWEYVGKTAVDEITGGGWLSSYTGEPFSKKEMDEYGRNVLEKIRPLIHNEAKVLEIGCATGITMYRIAPEVAFYYGTDLSHTVIEKNRERTRQEGRQNIALACLPAHEIDTTAERDFDLVIINSVIQCFHGHNYLRKVIRKAVDLLGTRGHLFVGDVMDRDLKGPFIRELTAFRQADRDKRYKTKTDFSAELFVSRCFFEDLCIEIPGLQRVEFREKIYTIENELTKFRYDALFTVDKSGKTAARGTRGKHKYQHDSNLLKRFDSREVPSKVSADDNAYIIYTSGTTGRPKGTCITHSNISPLLHWGYKHLGFGPGDRVLQNLSYFFDWSVWEIFMTLTSGSCLYITSREILLNPETCVDFIRENGITALHITPTQYQTLVNWGQGLKTLKYLCIGAEKLTYDLVTRSYPLVADDCRIFNMYGPTEAGIMAAVLEIDAAVYQRHREYRKLSSVPIGSTIANARLLVLDRGMNPCPLNVSGELYIAGDCLSHGYINKPELTAEKFPPAGDPLSPAGDPLSPAGDPLSFSASQLLSFSLYRTGDLVRWLPDGNIEYLGRTDQQVKLRGFRIELGEIEAQLRSHGQIKDVLVVHREFEPGDRHICAYYAADNHIEVSELREYLSRLLPDYMIPSYFAALDKIPLNSNGKVDIKALPLPGKGAAAEGKATHAPGNELEETLAALWSEILGIEAGLIGIDHDFFEWGGHSLKATLLVSEIHKELGIKVPLAEIFVTPTIRGLAAYIANEDKGVYQGIAPAPEGRNHYPQSSAQKRLFFLDRMEGIDTSYNIPFTLKVEGNLDPHRLENAFRELIRRHETLRTSFHLIDNEPVQKIHPAVVFEIERLDKNHTNIIEHFIRPFDLSRAPLLRVGLARLAEQEHLLLFDMHHIISDGTSMQILVNEVARLYAGAALPELRIQYKDFSWWQNGLFETGEVKSQEQYWLDLYSKNQGEIPVLNLPTDHPRSGTQDFRGAGYQFELGMEETAAFRELAAQNGATLFMNLLAAFNVLLHKYTDQEDITVGSGIAGRHHADLQDIIGFFVNTLAIRNYPQPYKTYEQFLEEVKGNCVKAFENQDFQFEELVRKLELERVPGRNPLFDIIFTLQNIERKEVKALDGLTFSSCDSQFETSQFDMSIDIYDRDDTIYFSVEYATALFKASTIERIAQQYMEVIRQVIHNRGIRLKDIELSHEFMDAVVPVHEEAESDFGF
jgi:amino acid adenylation domain-containing protein